MVNYPGDIVGSDLADDDDDGDLPAWFEGITDFFGAMQPLLDILGQFPLVGSEAITAMPEGFRGIGDRDAQSVVNLYSSALQDLLQTGIAGVGAVGAPYLAGLGGQAAFGRGFYGGLGRSLPWLGAYGLTFAPSYAAGQQISREWLEFSMDLLRS